MLLKLKSLRPRNKSQTWDKSSCLAPRPSQHWCQVPTAHSPGPGTLGWIALVSSIRKRLRTESEDPGCLELAPTYCVTVGSSLPLSEPHFPRGAIRCLNQIFLKNMVNEQQEGIPWNPVQGKINPRDTPGSCDLFSPAPWLTRAKGHLLNQGTGWEGGRDLWHFLSPFQHLLSPSGVQSSVSPASTLHSGKAL